MHGTFKERIIGLVLVNLILLPLAFLGWVAITWVALFGRTERGRAGVRALDHFVNAALFNGNAWESISSHAWRERERWWAKIVIRFTDALDQDHCRRANKREQHVVNLVQEKGLDQQTIF